jgi:hypothetical protein
MEVCEPPPDGCEAGREGAGADLLLLAAMAMVLMLRNAAATVVAEILRIALIKTGVVIESSFPLRSHRRAPLMKRSLVVQTDEAANPATRRC